jgi:class 3 adenylate cyclase
MPRASGTVGRGRRATPLRVASIGDEVDHDLQVLLGEQPDAAERYLAAVMFTEFTCSKGHFGPADERAWPVLTDECWSIVWRQAARYNGRLVQSGEGRFVRFSGAYTAVRCALAIKKDVHELGVHIRAGLHAAEGSGRDGDITDVIAHVANCICCVAGSDRVLASRAMADLVVGSGLAFENAGTHRLADLPGKWQLLAISE